MFWRIKQVFILLMSFSESLVTKCVPLNNDPCIVTPTFINLNTAEFLLKIVPVIISVTIKFQDFDLDNILIDKNVLVYGF